MAAEKASTKKKTVTKTVKRKVTTKSSATVAKDMVFNAPLGALFGELVGTFLLTAVVITRQGDPVIVLFALAAIVLIVGNLSGGHVNPAITFGAWVTRKISTLRAVGYILFQMFGAMLAYVALTGLLGGQEAQMNPYTGEEVKAQLFAVSPIALGQEWFVFWASLLGMSVFGFAVASAMRETKDKFAAAFAVGGGLAIGLFIAGASGILNPAVAVGLQAFTDLKTQELQFAILGHVIAPLIGSAIGFFLYDVFRKDADTSK